MGGSGGMLLPVPHLISEVPRNLLNVCNNIVNFKKGLFGILDEPPCYIIPGS